MWRRRNNIEKYVKNERGAKWHSGLQMLPLLGTEPATCKSWAIPGLTEHCPGVGSGCIPGCPSAALQVHCPPFPFLVCLKYVAKCASLQCEVRECCPAPCSCFPPPCLTQGYKPKGRQQGSVSLHWVSGKGTSCGCSPLYPLSQELLESGSHF